MLQEFDTTHLKGAKMPELRSGYTVRLHQKIREGDKERIQIFEGVIIAIGTGFGPGRTITVRKVVDGVGVEKIVPIHSPNVTKIEVTKKADVSRAKLYYLRKAEGAGARLHEEKHKEKAESGRKE